MRKQANWSILLQVDNVALLMHDDYDCIVVLQLCSTSMVNTRSTNYDAMAEIKDLIEIFRADKEEQQREKQKQEERRCLKKEQQERRYQKYEERLEKEKQERRHQQDEERRRLEKEKQERRYQQDEERRQLEKREEEERRQKEQQQAIPQALEKNRTELQSYIDQQLEMV